MIMAQTLFFVCCNFPYQHIPHSALLKEMQKEKLILKQARSVDFGFVIRHRIWNTRKLICSALN
jgi:hypothetical protein